MDVAERSHAPKKGVSGGYWTEQVCRWYFICSIPSIGGSLVCNSHALIKFVISENMGWAKNVVSTLNFCLFKEILWEILLREKGIEQIR